MRLEILHHIKMEKYSVSCINYYTLCITDYVFMYLVTSDVQAVNATAVGESTIDIQCWFIHGSDALGCKVVLVSDCPNISDVHANLSRSNMSASGQLNNIACYQRVFAFYIDVNNTISNLTIEGNITAKVMAECVCIHGEVDHSLNLCTILFLHGLLLLGQMKLPITVLIPTTLITILLIITVLAVIITFAIRQHKKKSKI